jgi:hypothetical protein
MWMELLQGEHNSTDVAVVEGRLAGRTVAAIGDGMFDYWVVEAARRRRSRPISSIGLRRTCRVTPA